MDKADTVFEIALQPQGHYGENNLTLQISRNYLKGNNNKVNVNMVFNPYASKESGSWEHIVAHDGTTKKPIGPIQYKEAKKKMDTHSRDIGMKMAAHDLGAKMSSMKI